MCPYLEEKTLILTTIFFMNLINIRKIIKLFTILQLVILKIIKTAYNSW